MADQQQQGRRVRAKRLGWDEPPAGPVTDTDELDPYDYPDDWVEGVLEVVKASGRYVTAYDNYLVAGQVVDPATVEDLAPVGAEAAAAVSSPRLTAAGAPDPQGAPMPWKVTDTEDSCDGWAVVNSETGKVEGCHDSEAEAQDHARALYANTDEGDAQASAEGRYAFTLAFEGIPTREAPAREFAPGVLSWVDPPFPLKWQEREDDGHKGSVIVGRVEEVWREDQRLRGVLQFDLDGEHGREAHRLVAGRFLRGGSLLADDIADPDVEFVFPAAASEDCPECEDLEGSGLAALFGPPPELVRFHAGRIRSWTLCAEPAFADALVDVADFPAGPVGAEALAAAAAFEVDNSEWDANAAMTSCSTAACYRSICAGRKAGPPDERGSWALPHHKTQGGPPNANGVRNALSRLPVTQGLQNAEAARRHLEAHLSSIQASALVAAAAVIEIPNLPPVEWFDEPTEWPAIAGGLTVTPEGRVYGLLAPRGMAHRGFDQLVTTPMGNVDYSAFQNKPAFCVDDAGEVLQLPAGNITMGCGHAPRHRPSARVGPEHYDNSCAVAARIRIGENDHGVWVAGALLPDVDGDQVARMLACELSGDWEPHRERPGWMKFVAAHLVPTGGLPSEQPDQGVRVRFRDGALVAAAVPVHLGGDPPPADELAAGRRRRQLADLLAAGVGMDQQTRRRQLAAIVHPANREGR